MKKRVLVTMVFIFLLSISLTGCGHEHSYTYAPNNDGTHSITCEGEKCEYSESGACEYSADYVCEICGHKHEHTFAYAINGDRTHTITCSVEGCEYTTTENCIYNADYVCETCGHKHEHNFAYAINEDGTHTITCQTEECKYSTTENCTYSEECICEVCGFIHEHNIVITSNIDGTHNKICDSCGFNETVSCVLNEEFVCTECAWTHEHILAYESVGDGTHNATCTFECCPYTNSEKCVNDNYVCGSCGYGFPKWTVEKRDAKTYYARKKLKVYKEPSTDSEVVKTLSVDDSIVCVGVVKKYKGKNVWFYQTDEGYFVEQDSKPKASGLKNLCPAKANQVYVFEFYPRIQDYDNLKFEAVYNSIDEALIDLTGHDREWYKANWEYDPLDMWGRDVYHSPKRVIEYYTTEDGYTFPYKSVSDGTIYIDKEGVVSSYAYGGFDEEGNWSVERGVIYTFDY